MRRTVKAGLTCAEDDCIWWAIRISPLIQVAEESLRVIATINECMGNPKYLPGIQETMWSPDEFQTAPADGERMVAKLEAEDDKAIVSASVATGILIRERYSSARWK